MSVREGKLRQSGKGTSPLFSRAGLWLYKGMGYLRLKRNQISQKMVQQVKALAVKPYLSLISRTHMVGENLLLQVLLFNSIFMLWHMSKHACAYIIHATDIKHNSKQCGDNPAVG